MGLINKRTRVRIGGLRVVIRPIEVNLGAYKRYGCMVVIRAIRRRRSNTTIVIQNHYFIKNDDIPGTPAIQHLRSVSRSSRNKRRMSMSEWKLNVGAEPFFPVVGVIATVRIRINGDERTFTFDKGAIDPEFRVPEPPRI